MRVTRLLCAQHSGYWFNEKWKHAKHVPIMNQRLRETLEAQGKEVVDAAKFFGVDESVDVDRYARRPPPEEVEVVDPQPSDPTHDVPAYVYVGHNLIMGFKQAQAITNTLVAGEGLPERISALEGLERLQHQDQRVADVIRTAKMFDATQEKLSKRIDITRLGLHQPREWGIPEKKANRGLFSGLLGLCEQTSLGPAGAQSRIVMYHPYNQATTTTPAGHRLLLRRRVEVALMSDTPLPPVAPPDAVAATRTTPTPDLTPVSPYADLRLRHDYDWRDLPPVSAGCRHRHVHTLFVSWNSRLKHRVDDSHLAAMSLMTAYTAALNCARQQTAPSPVTLQCVATDGSRFKFSVFQLNTSEIPEPGAGEATTKNAVKNLFWSEPAVPLFDYCGYRTGRPVLEGYNPEVFPKVLAMYSNGLLARTFDGDVKESTEAAD